MSATNASTGGLAGRALRGVRWNYLGAVGRIAATFVSQIALARLLGPEPFGLFGYAFLTVMLLGVIVEMGLPNALVQAPDLDDKTVAVALGRLLLAGTIAALGVYLAADLIAAHVFSNPQAAPVLRAMSPTLVVAAAASAATAMLSRDLEFKVIQLAALGSYVVGYLVVGIGAALMGLGVWSLVLAWHVQTLLACVIMARRSPRSLRPANPLRRIGVAAFGRVVMVTNVVNWVIDNGPHTAIGRWLGPGALGLYTVSTNLVKVPADHLVRNLQSVLLPLSARAQGNDAGIRRAYLTAMGGVGIVAFPVFVFVATTSEHVVTALLGAKWLAATTVLVPLSLAMVLHAVEAMAGPVLNGRGEPGAELRMKAIILVLSLPILAYTANWSLAAVGWGVAVVFLVRWILMNGAVARRLHITAGDFGRAMGGPLTLGIISAAVPSGIGFALHSLGLAWPAGWTLAMMATATALVLIVFTLAAPRFVLGPQLLALLHRLFEKRPALASRPGLNRVAAQASHAAREVVTEHFGAIPTWTPRPKTS